MKVNLVLTGVALVLTLGLGCANQQGGVQTTDQNGHYLTGSYIPQDVERNGPVTNGKSNVRVIDGSDIKSSGGADVNQTLQQLGVH